MKALITTVFVILLIIAFPVTIYAGEQGAMPKPSTARSNNMDHDYYEEMFIEDIEILIPLASSLKGQCIQNSGDIFCSRADSIMRVLRKLSLLNPTGKKGKADKEALGRLFLQSYLDGYNQIGRRNTVTHSDIHPGNDETE